MRERSQWLRFVSVSCVGVLVAVTAGISAEVDEQEQQQAVQYGVQFLLDGVQLVLEQEEDPFVGQLKKLGGKPLGGGARGSWSPDGARIAFGGEPFNAGVRIYDVKKGETTELVSPGKDPAWSPKDGRWIAYTREVESDYVGAEEEICLIEASGGEPRKLADGVFATWSADATTVYFYSRSTQQVMSLRIDRPDAEPTVLWDVPLQSIPFHFYPVVSPDGRCVALKDGDEVQVIEMKTGKTLHTCPAEGWRGFLAGWSPDGKRLAFGPFGGEEGGLWVLEMAGGQSRQLLPGWSTLPCWSPDGSRLAFDFRSRVLGYKVWVLDTKALGESAGPADKQCPRKGLKLLAFDGFDGKLGLNWKPVRHDPTHVSLTKDPGALTITTQRGSIHGDEKNDAAGDGLQAKNLFLIENPLAANTDFTITLAVKKFEPQTYYHQVALLCYDDDDNYLKWSYEHSWRAPDTQNFVLVRESDQQPEHDLVLNKPGLNRFWMRVAKRGDTYQCAWSTDGKNFEVVGEKTFGNGAPKYLGFLAKNGGNPQAAEIEVFIDSFKVRAP